jgi:hypothetical protein
VGEVLPVVQRFDVPEFDLSFTDVRDVSDDLRKRALQMLKQMFDTLVSDASRDAEICGQARYVNLRGGGMREVFTYDPLLDILIFAVRRERTLVGAFVMYDVEVLSVADDRVGVAVKMFPGFRIDGIRTAHLWANIISFLLSEDLQLADGRTLDVQTWEHPIDPRHSWDTLSGDTISGDTPDGDEVLSRLDVTHDRERRPSGRTERFRKRG